LSADFCLITQIKPTPPPPAELDTLGAWKKVEIFFTDAGNGWACGISNSFLLKTMRMTLYKIGINTKDYQ
jgi:hypothetical protein